MKNTITFFAMSAFALAPASALALPGERSETVDVRFADLDLSSDAGRATLDRRIEAAARKACRVGSSQTGTRISALEAKRCVARATNQVRNQIAAVEEQQRMGG